MIAAVVLAAGESRRMGQPKALLPFGRCTVIEGVIGILRAAGLSRIIVVLGHEGPLIANVICPLEVQIVRNERYREGMFSSAVAGVDFLMRLDSDHQTREQRRLASGSEARRFRSQQTSPRHAETLLPETLVQNGPPSGVLFSLVDQPCIPPDVVHKTLETFERNPGRIVLPACRGHRGHPIIFPWDVARLIPSFRGEGGLKGFREAHSNLIMEVPVDTDAILLDLDTPEDYRIALETLS